MAVTASTHPQRLAQAVCTWAETFDAAVSVVDVVGDGGLARGEAQFTLREVSFALRLRDLAAPISVVHADDLADALRDLSRRSPAIIAITTGHWTTPDRVHRSLARDVVRSANVPILLVPTNGRLTVEPGTGPDRGASRPSGSPR